MDDIFNSLIILDANTAVWKILIRLVFAIFAGIALGLESRSRSKDVGLKTHTILCLTSCLLIIISKYGFYELSNIDGIQYDSSRVASTIIPGLCFMGTAIVFYKKDSIKGLTTAASLCLTIAVGMCFGAGLIVIGAVVSVTAVILQVLLHHEGGIFKNNRQLVVRAKFYLDDKYVVRFKELFGIKHFLNFRVEKVDGKHVAEVEFYYKIKVSSEELVEMVQREPKIIMIEKY